MGPVTPAPNDVLLGRGQKIRNNPGNVAFRTFVDGRKAEFKKAKRGTKRNIAAEIIQQVLRNNGRFLMEDANCPIKTSGRDDIERRTWIVADDDKVLVKTMHRLREKEYAPKVSRARSDPVDEATEVAKKAIAELTKSACLDEPAIEEDLDILLDELESVCDGELVRDLDRGESRQAPLSSTFISDPPQPCRLRNDLPEQGVDLPEQFDGSNSMPRLRIKFKDSTNPRIDQTTTRSENSNSTKPPGSNGRNARLDIQLNTPDFSTAIEVEGSINSLNLQYRGQSHSIGLRMSTNNSQKLQCSQSTEESDQGIDSDLNIALKSMVDSNSPSTAPTNLPARDDLRQSPKTHGAMNNLRHWVDNHMPQGFYTCGELNEYIKAAIPIAIKLTQMLMDETQTEPAIELTSCNDLSIEFSAGEVIGIAALRTYQVIGTLDRLASLGAILFELFTGCVLPSRNAEAASGCLDELLLGTNEDRGTGTLSYDHAPKKKSPHDPSGYSQYYSKIAASLDDVGLPASLSGMLRNLLDCSRSEFRGDESYSSFVDVLTDLKLVRNNPCCYLDSPGNSPTFSIPNRLYDRLSVTNKIIDLYRSEACKGLIVNGRAGVGKSSLINQVLAAISKQDGSFVAQAKFEQAGINPLAIVALMFNSLCEAFIRDAQPRAKAAVTRELELALGVAGINSLSLVVPSLSGLLASSDTGSGVQYMNRAASVSYALGKLLEVIAAHFVPVTLLIDDLQFADGISRSIISSMLENAVQPTFFVCCYRDDDVKPGDDFSLWLQSVESSDIENVKIENLSLAGVNEMVSESLRAFPRITLPLATQLYTKTRGNPLFLRQFVDSLLHQGLVFLSLSPIRWAWDLDKISNIEMPVNVVALLIAEMQTLSSDLIQGLRVASCLGSSVKKEAIDIISSGLGLDLAAALDELVKKGFLVRNDDGAEVTFSHDKVHQSAYETMTTAEQQTLHQRLGLILCEQEPDCEYLLFAAVTQANLGGVDTTLDSHKRVAIATLNFRVGELAKEQSAFNTALGFFQNSILWIFSEENWTAHYDLTLAAHVSAVETACLLNNLGEVKKYTDELVANTKTYEERVPSLFCLMKSLVLSGAFTEAKNLGFVILTNLGEKLPRELGDPSFAVDVSLMFETLQSTTDETILNLPTSPQAELDILLVGVYNTLSHIFIGHLHKYNPDITRRMLQITLENGLSAISPHALAMFSAALADLDQHALAFRISKLAKRLVARPQSHMFASSVACTTGFFVDWMKEPLQSIAESHSIGHRSGLQVGDIIYAQMNNQQHILYLYLAGQELGTCRDQAFKLSQFNLKRKQVWRSAHHEAYHRMVVSLVEGRDFVDRFPSWAELENHSKRQKDDFSLAFCAHNYMRAFLFHSFDGVVESEGLTARLEPQSSVRVERTPLRPLFLIGVFYEGLLFFHLAQLQQHQDQQQHLLSRGNRALEFIKFYSNLNPFTFDNKYLLLEASRTEVLGLDQTELYYQKAIKSAHDNKFQHEEALASEMAGRYLFNNGDLDGSLKFYSHAISKYQTWGASAIVTRVEYEVMQKFGTICDLSNGKEIELFNDSSECQGSISRKRPVFD